VERRHPDILLHAWFDAGRCTLSLDGSGEALFKRGYRRAPGRAPLRENLAAGLILLTGWSGTVPFRDLFCGSGTLVIEAAWRAMGRAPGLGRAFGFERWPDFDEVAWARLKAQAAEAIRPVGTALVGSDIDPAAVEAARAHAAAAGRAEVVRFEVADFRETRGEAVAPPEGPGPRGLLLLNPPYGERIGGPEPLGALYKELGDVLKQRYKGWEAYVFTVPGEPVKAIGLRPKRRTILFNGALECRLLHYPLY
jgi:putative N6-adenine-specific DNA methylase